jgi:predicted enzyme related to lactoylglutathione lyase
MTSTHGRFVWYELMTTETEAAKAFYCEVVGWDSRDMPAPGMTYTLFTAQDGQAAGLMPQSEEARKAGYPPVWLGYVGVDDVDEAVIRVTDLGGTVHHVATDIPGVGRFAVIADPQSAVLGLMQWASPGPGDAPVPEPMTLGHTGWHELMAVEWPKALAFYSALFGWTAAEAVEMGEMGTYQLFAAGGQTTGGMFNKPPSVPVPFWLYYFCVDDIQTAAGRVTKAGGQIMNGPMQVPGGSWIVQCMDPQGAMFALLESQPAAA